MNTGENYTFQLSIANNNLTLRSDELFLAPEIFFSGNLIIKTRFILSKEGVIRYGTNKMIYGAKLRESEQSSTVKLPEIGEQVEPHFIYHCNQTYDMKDAALDEWLRLSLNIKVYGEVYSIQNGSFENRTYFAGPELFEFETDYYYIVSDEKIQYISNKISEIGESVESFLRYKGDIENKTGETLDIDYANILKDYYEIKDLFEKGDYISVSNKIENWRHRPEEILLNSLTLKLVQFSKYKTLAADIEDIKLSYLDEIYYKELEIKQLRDSENLYIYAIIGLGILSISLFVLRFKSRRSEDLDIIEKAKRLIGNR
ncbi:hypothetical protein KEJ21_00090 [Candidatus Bathyarchaeota archaeon]|nr:hypothetical protein [Candidatus Bathyarchaeota archaeon]MBS7630169.1 hypothetical protein [Candidatus Bathyarchaeota archaeon]